MDIDDADGEQTFDRSAAVKTLYEGVQAKYRQAVDSAPWAIVQAHVKDQCGIDLASAAASSATTAP